MTKINGKQPAMLGVTAFSGTGKTTLLQRLIPLLNARGVNVAIVKHSHHDVDIDIPGKDSYLLRKAGAVQTILASDSRWSLITETPEKKPVDLNSLITHFDMEKIDLVLVEGFKNEPIPKIMLYREGVGKPLTDLIDTYVIALAGDKPYDVSAPQLDINDPLQISEFIIDWLNRHYN